MPDQDSLTEDPTQKLPLLCRCGCTDHSSVQRCCQANEYLCSPMCSPLWPPPVFTLRSRLSSPLRLCAPLRHLALQECPAPAVRRRMGSQGRTYTWTCHVVQSCAKCLEQGWRIWGDLYGVLWSVMLPKVVQLALGTHGVRYPSPLGVFAFFP